jgi:hypothetical protein
MRGRESTCKICLRISVPNRWRCCPCPPCFDDHPIVVIVVSSSSNLRHAVHFLRNSLLMLVFVGGPGAGQLHPPSRRPLPTRFQSLQNHHSRIFQNIRLLRFLRQCQLLAHLLFGVHYCNFFRFCSHPSGFLRACFPALVEYFRLHKMLLQAPCAGDMFFAAYIHTTGRHRFTQQPQPPTCRRRLHFLQLSIQQSQLVRRQPRRPFLRLHVLV